MIDRFAKVEASDNNLTFFFANTLKLDRYYKDKNVDFKENVLEVHKNEDIVISGLGFIKVTKPGVIRVFTFKDIEVYLRNSLI
jgi:hypothetical protein